MKTETNMTESIGATILTKVGESRCHFSPSIKYAMHCEVYGKTKRSLLETIIKRDTTKPTGILLRIRYYSERNRRNTGEVVLVKMPKRPANLSEERLVNLPHQYQTI